MMRMSGAWTLATATHRSARTGLRPCFLVNAEYHSLITMQHARGMLHSAKAALMGCRVHVARPMGYPVPARVPAQVRAVPPFHPSTMFSTSSGSRQASGTSFDSPDPRKVIIFADYTVYKSKGVVSVKAIRPTWGKTGTGSGITVTRQGTLLLEFANARGERDYDWEKKEVPAWSEKGGSEGARMHWP